MDDLLSEFLTETNENLAVLDVELVHLEQNPNHPGLIDNIFRLVHTIKGTCGFLGLPRLESVAHASENVLGKIRDGSLVVTPSAVSLILESLDRIKSILAALEATEAEPEGDDSSLISRLDAMASDTPAAAGPVAVEAMKPEPVKAEPAPVGEPVAAAPVVAEAQEEPTKKAAQPPHGEQAKPAAKVEPERPDERSTESSIANQTIRVNVDLLENLMTMVSELVLSRNQLLQMVRGMGDSEFTVPLQRLSHVTTELQEGVMKTRMQPIGNAWAKMPRIIRDLSVELGKKIDLQMIGAETELDRQVLELIKDPLTHMVRNSADHGLETPAERQANGKTDVGKIVLNAYHEGGHIIIEIRDDGRGLDVARIKAKAIEKSLVSESEAEALTDQQIMAFIFKPGFSTAAKVTAVSGRGVGMDVVRTNIEKIGGNIELKSEKGRGSSFIIKIPLTLAIVSALIVECGGERFAIPQISVVELVRTAENSEHKIERINDTSVLRLRDRLLPLVFLTDTLKLADRNKEGGAAEAFIVVTQVGTFNFGIVVDRVFDTEEIVVKPVAPILRDIPMFSGNTILGDGSVIMILDPNGIAAASGEATLGDAHAAEEERRHDVRGDDRVALLVFRAGGSEPKAVPLSLVARLEEIEVSQVERSNNQLLVQYRGRLMPLVKIDDAMELKTEGRQPILVFADDDRSMGLMVDEIVDIVEDRLDIQLTSNSTGTLGSAVVAGHATDIVDVGHYLSRAFGDWFNLQKDTAFGGSARSKRVLLVDDSPFFRNMLSPLLAIAGYEVTTAEDAATALRMREAGRDFDVIISDIEMPGMNGFEFAEAVKSGDRWQETPIVALSSHTSPGDFNRGREVGFADYVAKFDRDALLNTLSQTLANGDAA